MSEGTLYQSAPGGFTTYDPRGAGAGYVFGGERARILAKRLAYIEKHGAKFLFDNAPPPAPGWPRMTPRERPVSHSRIPNPSKREAMKATVAQVVADGGFVKDAAPILGISRSYAGKLWREILAEMGEQAK